ncbi:CLUMA_CG013721, isoform A [Clunio marinus]|uniref:CLUMA_CG013721, isoform A n=1 Tax=Clunio marinus TaxID=568069 RepID=A0A1J1IL17_9DIPT|nr:CLUMA_CG013721, isoform A [Clunio marinus]
MNKKVSSTTQARKGRNELINQQLLCYRFNCAIKIKLRIYSLRCFDDQVSSNTSMKCMRNFRLCNQWMENCKVKKRCPSPSSSPDR